MVYQSTISVFSIGRFALVQAGKPSPAGKLTKPDSEDPDTVNHLNWYMSTGFTRPYPGESAVRPPREFNNPAPAGDDD